MITVILPVLNEPSIASFLEQLHQVLASLHEEYEVLIVVGDRETLYPRIPILFNQRIVKSYGDSLERAILLGFSVAKGEKLVVMDADGSHPIEKIPELLKGLDEHDLVVGSRFMDGSSFEQSFFRRVISRFYVKYAQFLGSWLTDPMSGFFVVRKELVEKTRFKPYKWKTALELELKSEVNPCELPIHFKKREAGFSKAKLGTGFHLLWDIFWDRL